ncbi:hypothetical protein PBY51_022297 [Eleginops maclovinus]|uniref:Uncharacterized protein n=1 Tax=Eleginops maclovinus TaxID=56733 RepID=A0AAN7XHM9_ELEMC|nr:hypothetical protein PBY51_022297 [Eleginops maclovinus]
MEMGGVYKKKCPTNRSRARGEVKTAEDELVTITLFPTPNPPQHTHALSGAAANLESLSPSHMNMIPALAEAQ